RFRLQDGYVATAQTGPLARALRDLRRAFEVLVLPRYQQGVGILELRVGIGDGYHLVPQDVVNRDDEDPVAVRQRELAKRPADPAAGDRHLLYTEAGTEAHIVQ